MTLEINAVSVKESMSITQVRTNNPERSYLKHTLDIDNGDKKRIASLERSLEKLREIPKRVDQIRRQFEAQHLKELLKQLSFFGQLGANADKDTVLDVAKKASNLLQSLKEEAPGGALSEKIERPEVIQTFIEYESEVTAFHLKVDS